MVFVILLALMNVILVISDALVKASIRHAGILTQIFAWTGVLLSHVVQGKNVI